MKTMTFLAATLATFGAFAAFEEKTTDFEAASTLATSAAYATTLDLSDCWDMTALDAQTVPYSSVGWDAEEAVNSRTVSLTLVPEGELDVMTLASGLKGRDTFAWQPADMSKKVYVLSHNVYSGSTLVTDEKMTARYSFVNCQMKASEADVLLALMALGHECSFTNDGAKPWQPINGTGDGVASVKNTDSELVFVFEGAGTFYLNYKYVAGTFTLLVDGVAQAVASSEDWKALALNVATPGEHVVKVRYQSAGASVAALKGCHWQESASAAWQNTASPEAQVDLRGGIRLVKKPERLYPFAYSITNFTGLSGVTDSSLVRVRVVRCEGEGTDISAWTNEVAGTEKVLPTDEDESTVGWEGRNGVWKAEFGVYTGNKTNHQESAYFDMRKFGIGFLLMVR